MKYSKTQILNKSNIDNLAVNTIRFLSVDMINKANSGHPGIALGSAPILHTLFTKHLNISNLHDKWINRDRFVLSAGHGSSALYATLHLLGFPISIEDIQKFRQLNSLTPGHPEITITKGIDATTGPLGQGLAMALGMAIAEDFLAKQFNKDSYKIIDHYTYALCGDGCLQEGISQEVLSLAGKLGLNKFIILFDSNDVQLDSMTKACVNENMKMRATACGWNYIKVKDGNNVIEIDKAILEAKKSKSQPTLIEVKTIIGYGSPKQGTPAVHGAPIGEEAAKITKKLLNWPYLDNFYVPEVVYDYYKKCELAKTQKYQAWVDMFSQYEKNFSNEAHIFQNAINKILNINWNDILKNLATKETDSTRNISALVIKEINNFLPNNLIAGSADLSVSTKIKGFNGIYGDIDKGNNILFGVREFAMGAITNGITLHLGLQAYCSTFMTFADYTKPAMRLTSLMEINSGFIFSHDSIMVGEDGPTHQPIEQLTMLRTIPNNVVFKPCNYLETVAAFKFNLENPKHCWTLITSRQDFLIPKSPVVMNINNLCECGAYVIDSNSQSNYFTILASGYEVALALEVKKLLSKDNIDIRVVSVPCLNIFLNLPKNKQNAIIGNPSKKIIIELADGITWNTLINHDDLMINIKTFGCSGKDMDVLNKYGFNPESLKNTILKFKMN